jgi:hypothetical protein
MVYTMPIVQPILVGGFPFDPTRDAAEGQVPNHSPWGQPDCKTWWTDPQNGLRAKLAQAMPPTLWEQLFNLGGNTQQIQDASLKSVLQNTYTRSSSLADTARGYESLNDNASGDLISRFISAPMGVAFEGLSFFPKLHLLINALPVMQGSLLFALYAFLALAIPFSSYRINLCVTGSIIMFSLIFCTYIWQLTAWFDNYLIQALYPSLGSIPGLGSILDSGFYVNELFVDMIIGTLYIILPILWLTMMTWAGFKTGSFAEAAFAAMAEPAYSAGNKAGNVVHKRIS